jgi:hypothetical protein
VKAGRECAGYERWRDLSRSSRSPSPQELLQRRARNAEEDHLFQIFLEDGGRQSVLASDVRFWTILIPQLCEAEPAIRYATLALGALMAQQRSIKAFSEAGPESTSALIYYNKSIKALLSSATPVSKSVALVSNVLFTCMECMQRRDSEALGLFHQGRRMFEEHWSTQDQPSEILTSLRSFLSRLRLLALFSGPPMADYQSSITGDDEDNPAKPFASYDEARLSFFYLSGLCHASISEGSRARLALIPQDVVEHSLMAHRDALLDKLRSFKERFMPLLEGALCATGAVSDQIAVLTLQCQMIIVSVWTACSLSSDEMIWDQHLGSFTKILNICARVIDLLESENIIQQPFSIEFGLIAPLYMSGRLCRDPSVRQSILELLERGRQQEGLWQARVCAAILRRIYAIEDAGRLPGQYLPEDVARLRATMIHPRKTGSSGTRGNVVQFFLTPKDPSQGWNVWEEWIEAL